ncbi:MAG TPA: ADP-ribosylglycohydrolase family protein [Candidatus Cloacimonadota bacterium]|jgi:ADP-ribosylglycohydrolase|nr:ADP-ribosylglycohydrolase family protein [Candidatus Cloacimonadota bacterium]
MNKADLVKNILYGVAVGDAIGFPYQFKSRKQRRMHEVIDICLSRDHEGNLFRQDDKFRGLWSDDSSLTLCLAESLASGYDLKDQAVKFVAWLEEGYLSAKDYAFDVGGRTCKALGFISSLLKSNPAPESSQLFMKTDIYANGNGALMRILPLVTYSHHKSIDEQYRIVQEASSLTHPHPRSVLVCFFYLLYAQKLIDGVEKFAALEQTREELKEFMKTKVWDSEDTRELDRIFSFDFSRFTTDPDDRDRSDYLSSGGYVIHTLEAALWCLLTSSDYKETVLKAVNLGDDTDTTAAVGGGLAALLWGWESIPAEWIDALKKPEVFQRIVGLYE